MKKRAPLLFLLFIIRFIQCYESEQIANISPGFLEKEPTQQKERKLVPNQNQITQAFLLWLSLQLQTQTQQIILQPFFPFDDEFQNAHHQTYLNIIRQYCGQIGHRNVVLSRYYTYDMTRLEQLLLGNQQDLAGMLVTLYQAFLLNVPVEEGLVRQFGMTWNLLLYIRLLLEEKTLKIGSKPDAADMNFIWRGPDDDLDPGSGANLIQYVTESGDEALTNLGPNALLSTYGEHMKCKLIGREGERECSFWREIKETLQMSFYSKIQDQTEKILRDLWNRFNIYVFTNAIHRTFI